MLRGEMLMREIARKHGVRYADLRSRSRDKRVVVARIEIARALWDGLGFNGPKIARMMRKDHTSIYFYLGRVARRKPRNVPEAREVA